MKTVLTRNDAVWEIEHEGYCEMPGTYILMETWGTMLDANGKELEAIGALNPPVITCSFCGAEAVRMKIKSKKINKTAMQTTLI